MKLSDFSLAAFNQTAATAVAGQCLDFCRAVTLSYTNNLSITARYTPALAGERFAVLDAGLNPVLTDEFDNYYYGVSPEIDGHLIITAISKGQFSTPEGLDAFIAAHSHCFTLHADQAAFLADFARHAVLTVSLKYGIRLHLPAETQSRLAPLDPHGEILQKKGEHLEVHGCPTREMWTILAGHRYTLQEDVWHAGANGCTLEELYGQKQHIHLLEGRVFYSGVLIKPLCIHRPEERFENFHMKNVCLDFERSSFATVCALDEVHICHPLLAASADNLLALFRYDDDCKQELATQIDAAAEEDGVWDCLNRYLLCCVNVNQIVVTANIITKEKAVLFGLRDSQNIDEGFIYPSVNGNAEIRDNRVAFYTYSVYEDDPTIRLEDKRIDFIGEIDREAYGEIRMDGGSNWQCYGLTLSGQLPHEPLTRQNAVGAKRRLHFNILFERTYGKTIQDIHRDKEKASESFETTFFKGIRVFCYKSVGDWLVQRLLHALQAIADKKDVVESLSLLTVILLSLFDRDNSPRFGWADWLSVCIAVPVTLVAIINTLRTLSARIIWRNRSVRKKCTMETVHIFCTGSYATLCRKLDKAIGHNYHPAAYAALKLYAENYVYDRLAEKPKKKKI
ncbi:MAG: hypothetical protein IJ518_02815 [Clostridia bacterium]|nr:hypothetical protein [Clostridia bacterium]